MTDATDDDYTNSIVHHVVSKWDEHDLSVNEDTGEETALAPINGTGISHEQARVNSVARTLDAAMARASTLILTPEEIIALKADFPDEAFKPGAAGKENLIYIEHAFLHDRFDTVIGMGQWALVRTRPHWAEDYPYFNKKKNGMDTAVRVYADCALLIRECYISQAIGDMSYFPSNAGENFGDCAEGSETQAFRRCAKKFGVGLQAWKKDWCEGWWQRKTGNSGTKRNPAPSAQPAVEPENESQDPSELERLLEKIKGYTISELYPFYGRDSNGHFPPECLTKDDRTHHMSEVWGNHVVEWSRTFGADASDRIGSLINARYALLKPSRTQPTPAPEDGNEPAARLKEALGETSPFEFLSLKEAERQIFATDDPELIHSVRQRVAQHADKYNLKELAKANRLFDAQEKLIREAKGETAE